MMKKIVSIWFMLVVALSGMAQTNFRHITYKEALEAAKAENKLVFLDFYAMWCGPCKKMLNDIFPLKNVGDYFNEKFVCVKINTEEDEGPELSKQYKVQALPTFVVIDENEKVVTTMMGGRNSGDELIASIDRKIDPERQPERLQARYDSGERTANLISSFAELKLEQSSQNFRVDMKKREEAFKLVRDYYESLDDAQKLLSENLFVYTSFTEFPGEPSARYMIENRDKFAADIQDQVAERIAYWYKREVQMCLMGLKGENRLQSAVLKQEIEDLGLNKDGVYTVCLELIESYGTGDLDTYLKLCERKYKKLNDDEQKYFLLTNFSGLMQEADVAQKKRAIKFIRTNLIDMKASMLSNVSNVLIQLEKGTEG